MLERSVRRPPGFVGRLEGVSRVVSFDEQMACQMCQQERKLCKSHIIPEFVYRPMYDEKHRYEMISTDPQKPLQKKQKGVRERLLCQSCETKLSLHENYVSKLIHGGVGFSGATEDNLFLLSGLEYKHIRLCYLSILWRMSISRSDIFSKVSLGPHEEFLRKMILRDEPGEANQYGFVGAIPYLGGRASFDYILPPSPFRCHGHWVYLSVIGGILFHFFMKGERAIPEIQRFFPQTDGTWVLLAQNAQGIPFMDEFFHAAARVLR
jgi:hypothetical protein